MSRIVLALALLALVGTAMSASAQGVHCTSTRVGNSTFTHCY